MSIEFKPKPFTPNTCRIFGILLNSYKRKENNLPEIIIKKNSNTCYK